LTVLSERVDLPVTFAQHARSLLEREITEGRLAGGQRVREVELASMLGISRTPVREALRTLERDGLVVRVRGRGTFIAPLLEANEIVALYSVRIALEPFLAGCAAARLDSSSLDVISAAQHEFHEIASRTDRGHADIQSLLAANTKFHLTIYFQAGSTLTTVVESYWARLLRERYSQYARSDRARLIQYSDAHHRIIGALRRRDAADASRLVKEHLESGVAVLRGIPLTSSNSLLDESQSS
jgi:DNA-binding GntR family transcriptional regulator